MVSSLFLILMKVKLYRVPDNTASNDITMNSMINQSNKIRKKKQKEEIY